MERQVGPRQASPEQAALLSLPLSALRCNMELSLHPRRGPREADPQSVLN